MTHPVDHEAAKRQAVIAARSNDWIANLARAYLARSRRVRELEAGIHTEVLRLEYAVAAGALGEFDRGYDKCASGVIERLNEALTGRKVDE